MSQVLAQQRMCSGLRLQGQTRVANLSVPVDGGPNTLPGVLQLDRTHGKTSKENTDLRLDLPLQPAAGIVAVWQRRVLPFH